MTSDQQTLMKFSDIAMYMQPSAIRRLLKVTETPDLISFGGGLPNPESFPIKEIKEIFNELSDKPRYDYDIKWKRDAHR